MTRRRPPGDGDTGVRTLARGKAGAGGTMPAAMRSINAVKARTCACKPAKKANRLGRRRNCCGGGASGDRNMRVIVNPHQPRPDPATPSCASLEPSLSGQSQSIAAVRLPDAPGAAHTEARAFCLAVIKQEYGFEYRSDWHADLDSLCLDGPANHYAAQNRGGFWVARNAAGALVATIGVKQLDWQAALSARLAPRYPRPEAIGAVSRAYVRAELRGQGLGARLTALCVESAQAMGYRTLYLHTNSDAEAAQRFWRSQGWRAFDAFGISTHFERHLPERATP